MSITMQRAVGSEAVQEEQAEEILLALGGALTWREHRWRDDERVARVAQVAVPETGHPRPVYEIRCREEMDRWVVSIPFRDGQRKLFKTLLAAKSACERHYATGSWE